MEQAKPVSDMMNLADELDPPEPSTVVYTIIIEGGKPVDDLFLSSEDAYAYVEENWITEYYILPLMLPAHILKPDEVAVKVPPVSEWPESATDIVMHYSNEYNLGNIGIAITRAEAERMEATK